MSKKARVREMARGEENEFGTEEKRECGTERNKSENCG